MHLGGRFFLIRHYSTRKLTQQTNMSDIILKDVRSYSEQEKALMKLDQGTTTQKSFIFDGLMRICQNVHEVK